MDHPELQRRFGALTTAHLADACLRARVPLRCVMLRAVVPGSHLAGRVAPARHVGSVDIFLEVLEDGVLFVPAARAAELFTISALRGRGHRGMRYR